MKVLTIFLLGLGTSLSATTPLLTTPPIYTYAEIKRESPSFPGMDQRMIEMRRSSQSHHFQGTSSYPYVQHHHQSYPAQTQTFSIPSSEFQARPLKYVPPRITFHPPKIIVSNTGVTYTQPTASFSGPGLINYSAPVQYSVDSTKNSGADSSNYKGDGSYQSSSPSLSSSSSGSSGSGTSSE